jgi:hypothetical protein
MSETEAPDDFYRRVFPDFFRDHEACGQLSFVTRTDMSYFGIRCLKCKVSDSVRREDPNWPYKGSPPPPSS